MRGTDGKIYIMKRSASEWFVAFIFFLPFAQAFLSQLLGLPGAIKFFADILLIMLLVKVFLICRYARFTKQLRTFLTLIGIFFAYVTVGYFFNYQSIFYYVWGLRNYFRFYVAFIAYVFFLKWSDVKRWLKLLDWLYVLNFFCIIAQFLMGYRQDYLGGLFGVEKGCNGGLLFFMTIISTKTILSFMRSEESVIKCLVYSLMSLLIAALSELKFFFLIYIIIVIMAMIMTKSSVRKTVFFIFGVAMILIFSSLLSVMYDEFTGFLSLDNLWTAIFNPNYASKDDIGRITAIPTISEYFLRSVPEQLFGMGLGNADASSLALFNTPFYDMYNMLHYSIISYAMLYLETGIVGLLLYTSFFVVSFVSAYSLYKRKKADENVCQLAMITSVICIPFMLYNSALRHEMAGYLVFFVLSLPLISAGAARPRDTVGN